MKNETMMEVNLIKSPLIKKDYGKISSYYVEVTIPLTVPDEFHLIFQNYYVSSITIAQELPTGMKMLLEKKTLMEQAFNEAEAYEWHWISGKALIEKGMVKGRPLRIYLFQATDMWLKFELRNLKATFIKANDDDEIASSLQSQLQLQSEPSTLSGYLLKDLKLLSEAVKVQSAMKQTSEYTYTQESNSKRLSRRKDRKK